ncbi:histidine phosphatase family protein [Novosphingobium guangzhouense]|uniref:Histidine phosphatase family protein n=1 Tax=Novosphingobium guangzhouense TaxID=1850347 RepID=A0A2K2FV79_9SPHN|nr:histidine phosphatase family protein [Novosphingobium guangzhouense]PNU02691.1 histidine phosphatase family protein [Novosphingobium guangzhouense]
MTGIAVHLMRHGAPRRQGLLLGHRDEPALAASSALCVARAQGLAFDRVVSSDLCRTLVPAAEIAAARGLKHAVDTDWRELDFGDWTGRTPDEVDPDQYARFWDDPDLNAPPNGERWSTLRERVWRALGRLREPSLVITHGGTMRAAIAVLFHMEHTQVWAFDLPYGSVLSLRIWPQPVGVGDAGHVAAAQITGLTS